MTQALLSEWKREDGKDGSGVRAAFESSNDINANKVSRSLELANELGIPDTVVLEQSEWAETEHKARSLEQQPVLAKWAEQDRRNAALARDDTDGLLGVFDALKPVSGPEFAAQVRGRFPMTEQGIADARRARGVSEDELKYGAFLQTPNPGFIAQIPALLKEGATDTVEGAAKTAVMLSERLQGDSGLESGNPVFDAIFQQREQTRKSLLSGFSENMRHGLELAEHARSAPLEGEGAEWLFQNFIRMAPQIAGTAASVGLGGAATGTAFMGTQIAGPQYMDLTEKGVSTERATTAATLNAAAQAPLEMIGFSKLARIFQSTGLKNLLGRVGVSMGTEAATEFLQAFPESASNIWGEAEINGMDARGQLERFVNELPETAKQGALEGLVASLWGIAGGVGRVATSRAHQTEALDFVTRQKEIHASVEASKTKQLAPSFMEDALKAGGMTQNAHLPADAVLQLYQSGVDVITPMGWDVADVKDAAAMGQDLEAPLSGLHSYLDAAQFESVANIMRAAPEAMNGLDAALAETMEEDEAENLRQAVEQYQVEQSEIDAEYMRVREEIAGALASVPGLDASIAAEGMKPETAASYYADLVTRWAERRQEHTGTPVAESLRKFNIQGLMRDERGRLLTPSEMQTRIAAQEQKAADFAKAEASRPFWESVWGRLDPDSLKLDFPDVYQELSKLHGRGLFKKGGVAVDELADELESRYLLEPGGGGDALVERLKQERKPGRRMYQGGTVVEVRGGELGVPEGSPIKDYQKAAREVYSGLQKTPARREDLGEIKFSRVGFGKMQVSGADPRKWQLLPKLKEIIESAEYIERRELEKERKDDVVAFHWLEADVVLDGKALRVGLQIAEDRKGNKFYNLNQDLEAWRKKYEALDRTDIRFGGQELQQDALTSSEKKITTVSDGVNLQILPKAGSKADNARASIMPMDEGYLINLYKKADLSSLLHETGHLFLEELEYDIRAGVADEKLQADYSTLRQWLGAPEGADLTREQREQFARGFEMYLREGKSPSKALESAFERFKKWLERIYKQARQLRVELTPEVRGVFDRLLATELEVDTAAARAGLLEAETALLDSLGVKGADRIHVVELMKSARKSAAVRLQEARDHDRKAMLSEWKKEAREELQKEPVYQARQAMRGTPLDLELIRADFGEDTARDLMRRLPGSLKKDGADPEVFAAEHGYDSGAALVSALLESQGMGAAIAERVKARQEAHDAQFDAADYLLETDELAEQMEIAGRYISRAMEGDDKLADPSPEDYEDFGKRAQKVASREAVRRVVTGQLAGMEMGRAIRADNFRQAMRRALEKERRAVATGDFAAALEANTQARLNMEFARQSVDIKRNVEKLRDEVRSFGKKPKATITETEADARFIVMSIGVSHGLSNPRASLAEGRDSGTLEAWLKDADEEGYKLDLSDAVLRGATPWRKMTGTDFQAMADAVKQIVTVTRNRKRLLTAQGKANLDEVAEELKAQALKEYKARDIELIEKKLLDTPKSAAGFVHAALSKVEFICDALDGGKAGVWTKTIFRPVTAAIERRDLRLKQEIRTLQGKELFGRYTTSALGKKVLAASVGKAFTLEQRLAVALNMGNADNRARLRDGHGYDDAQLDDIVNSLSAEDWNFVSNVWRYLESFREESFAVERELTGLEPKAVEPTPFMTKYGVVSGGYYPISYDPAKGLRAFELTQKEDDTKVLGGRNYGSAQTAHGHLKARSAGGLGEPVKLSLSVATDHVFRTVHDFSMRKTVLDVAKVLRRKDVMAELGRTIGLTQARLFMPWLQDASMMQRDPSGLVDKIMSNARCMTTVFTLGFKSTVLVQQFTGFLQGVDRLGWGGMARGFAKVYGNIHRWPSLYREMCDLSPFMATRMKSYDRDIKQLNDELVLQRGVRATAKQIKKASLGIIGLCQFGVDFPVWMGAYEKAMRENGGDMKEAAAYADSVVRMTQGSGRVTDLAAVQRGNETAKLFTMYYSFFNTQYNMWARQAHVTKSARDVPRALNCVFLTAVFGPVLAALLSGQGPDDEDDESWLEWGAKLAITYPFMTLPVVRDVVNGVSGDYPYQITPVAGTAARFIKLANRSVEVAAGERDAEDLILPAVEVGGFLSNGLITQQTITTGMGVARFLSGDDFEITDLFKRRRD